MVEATSLQLGIAIGHTYKASYIQIHGENCGSNFHNIRISQCAEF